MKEGRKVTNRGALWGGVIAGTLMMTGMSSANAQDVGGFEQIPADQSPLSFKSDIPVTTVFLRQYRENSTVFVGRWLSPAAEGSIKGASDDLFVESVFSTSAPGFAFNNEMSSEQLLEMFDGLRGRSTTNGMNFIQDTRYGPIAMTPFIRAGSQCVSFVGQWNPDKPTVRGSRLLGYYCDPVARQTMTDFTAPPKQLDVVDAQLFGANFFARFDVQLPDGVVIPSTQATPEIVETPSPAALPDSNTTDTPSEGLPISTNWQGSRGQGMLKFDQPSGEGTMIIDSDLRHCEGIWRHDGGAYQSNTLPFGSWYVFCDDGASARGHYTSEDPGSVTGEGQDNQGQAVYFRQINS
ncbi:MAG: hypothetical protein CMO02_08860 [Thalassospira sp.]|nr:hypothetical protein [Thalassospira sp.]